MSRIQLDQTLVKKPYQKILYTKDELTEFIKCADPVTGPLYFHDKYEL